VRVQAPSFRLTNRLKKRTDRQKTLKKLAWLNNAASFASKANTTFILMNRLPLLCILLLFTIAAQAQTTSVTGRVVDGADQSPLIGANIRLRGLGPDSVKNGAAADPAGNFMITGLPAAATS
jgi:hypothetical protein